MILRCYNDIILRTQEKKVSWDFYIRKKNGDPYPFRNNLKGGTYQIGECDEAWLNVTYNYGRFYYPILEKHGIKSLSEISGKTVKETLPMLREIVDTLTGEPSKNYWEPCEGNARVAMCQLVYMAECCPDGVWEVL